MHKTDIFPPLNPDSNNAFPLTFLKKKVKLETGRLHLTKRLTIAHQSSQQTNAIRQHQFDVMFNRLFYVDQ